MLDDIGLKSTNSSNSRNMDVIDQGQYTIYQKSNLKSAEMVRCGLWIIEAGIGDFTSFLFIFHFSLNFSTF